MKLNELTFKENKLYHECIAKLKNEFIKIYQCEAKEVFTSPGRIELLGNHTDHNNGFTLVSTVDLDIIAVTTKSDDNLIEVVSDGFNKMIVDCTKLELNNNDIRKSISMIKGVCFRFKELSYHIGGFKVFMNSRIFRGAGVSSSAAFELLFCEILNYYYNKNAINRIELAKIAQFSESNYFGKPCGLLDQIGASLGGVNFVDFFSNNNPKIERLEPKLNGYHLILTNTGGSHTSLTPYYAEIKDDMRKVAQYFGTEVLREVNYQEFIKSIPFLRKKIGGRTILRALHYFDENERVLKAFEAIKNDEISLFVQMVKESGESSYKLLQNCTYGKDKRQNVALGLELSRRLLKKGAVRVHGGGFAGTILAVVPDQELEMYLLEMRRVFGKQNCVEVYFRPYGVDLIEE